MGQIIMQIPLPEFCHLHVSLPEAPSDKAHTAVLASASQCFLLHRTADLLPGYFMLSYRSIYASTSRRGNRAVGSAEIARNAHRRVAAVVRRFR